MNKQCGTEVDVLLFMFPTFPVSHLEMSALKAPVSRNTTHHPKRRKQWTRKGGWQEMMPKTTNTAGGAGKINQKNKSVTPSNEQTVWNRGGRTASHCRHLPRLPIGNVGIECSSTGKHYPPPET